MSGFALSKRSLEKLEGVEEKLKIVVMRAIHLTKVDFGVICGLRTLEEQKQLVESGASQTLKSKHLEGQAVDLMAYIGSRSSWELNLYDDIAEAMKQAAIDLDVPLRWGAAWTVPDIRDWSSTMEEAMQSYIAIRREQGKRPFIDAPHFELV
jgi:peptidoglycan L-alanyl-D-glutamate endopeptidase CwlK